MRIIMWLLIFILPAAASAEEIAITVKGMVCSFCAQGIEKSFRSNPDVERVEVKLDEKIVRVYTAERTLADAEVTRIINDAGYDVVKIDRKAS